MILWFFANDLRSPKTTVIRNSLFLFKGPTWADSKFKFLSNELLLVLSDMGSYKGVVKYLNTFNRMSHGKPMKYERFSAECKNSISAY